MKNIKVLGLLLITTTLTACTFDTTPKETYSFERIQYELKPGVDESEIQGAPWINSNLPDMVAKIEKPSLKDDFYASVNYEQLVNNEPGPFDISYTNVWNTVFSIFYDEDCTAPNANLIRRTLSLVDAGAQAAVNELLDDVDISFFSSKSLFTYRNSFVNLDVNDNGDYQITYNDGYIEGDAGLHTLMFFGSAYQDWKDRAVGVKNLLFQAFDTGINAEEYGDLETAEVDTTYGAYAYSYSHAYNLINYTIGATKSYEFLDNALIDVGFKNGDTLKISNLSSHSLSSLNYYINNYSDVIVNALKCRLAFEFRFLAGLNLYKPISRILSNSYYFMDENLTNVDNDSALRVMTRLSLFNVFEKAYIHLAGDVDVKNEVTEIIELVLDAYRTLADKLSWIDIKTKKGLLRKINAMTYVSCYSDLIKNYPSIDETGLDTFSLFDIYNKYCAMMFDVVIAKQIDNNYFWKQMPSYTVNAFYSVATNEFVILNGLLSGGFVGDTIEESLGGVGFVVGHEISHSIDSSGSRYDEHGREKNWWTESSRKKFEKKVNKMVEFYNQINLFDDVYCDGSILNTEATADMGGMHVCLEIAKKIKDFDYDKFFRAYAKTWLSVAFSEQEIARRASDAHPYDYLRCNLTLAQFDKFIETYDIKKGDGMYIPKSSRIAIW